MNGVLRITEGLLLELKLLFENPGGAALANGMIDAGFNCFSKALVTSFLAQLQGFETHFCSGQALVAWVRPQPWTAYHIDPHAWVITKAGRIMDLSITELDGQKYFTAGHTPLPDRTAAITPRCTFSAKRFQNSVASVSQLSVGAHAFYYEQKRNAVTFDDLNDAGMKVNSPPTKAILARWPNDNVLAKAILHSHLVLTGERSPLRGQSQIEAWMQLADWRIDALAELKARHLESRQGQRRGDRTAGSQAA